MNEENKANDPPNERKVQTDQSTSDPTNSTPPTTDASSSDGETLSKEEQMARYEESLKDEDWGHQPC